jgi:cytochrome P450
MFFGEMEVKAVVHQLLLRFRWSVPAGYVMKQDFTTLPMPKDGLPVRLERL